jgi:hypothetical protein
VLRALLVEGTRLDRIRGVTQDRLGELEAATVL